MARSKYQKCGNLITMKANTVDKLQDLNSDAVASEIREIRLLNALETVLDIIDARDGLLNNEFEIRQAKKLIVEAKEQNQYQYSKDHQEQLLLDNVVDMFPEHVGRMA